MLVYVLNTSAGLREMFRSLELRMGLACVCVWRISDQRYKTHAVNRLTITCEESRCRKMTCVKASDDVQDWSSGRSCHDVRADAAKQHNGARSFCCRQLSKANSSTWTDVGSI